MATDWYCKIDESEIGPLSDRDLRSLVSQGKLTKAGSIKKGANGSWHSATEVKGLFPTENMHADAESSFDREPENPRTFRGDQGAAKTATDSMESHPHSTGNLPTQLDAESQHASDDFWGDDARDSSPPSEKAFGEFDSPSMQQFGELPWASSPESSSPSEQNDAAESIPSRHHNGKKWIRLLALAAFVMSLLGGAAAFFFSGPQSLRSARVVDSVKIRNDLYAMRPAEEGEHLLLRLRFSRAFLEEHGAGTGEEFSLAVSDFWLIADGVEQAPIWLVEKEDVDEVSWQLPLAGPGNNAPSFRSLMEGGWYGTVVDRGTGNLEFRNGRWFGSQAIDLSGSITGRLTLSYQQPSRPSRPRLSGRNNEAPSRWVVHGTLEGKPDKDKDLVTTWEFSGTECRYRWSEGWNGYSVTSNVTLSAGGFGHGHSVTCLFSRPHGVSELLLQFKDGTPLELPAALLGD